MLKEKKEIICGVYGIKAITKESSFFGRWYIGKALNIYARWDRHKNDLKKNKHSNKQLSLVPFVKKVYSFISPSGEIVCTNNITDLTRKNGINPRGLCAVSNGEAYSCKGWIKAIQTLCP